ncbi:hypothetical protein MRX96_039790 [Rhipicephalus microplus]
MAQCRSTPAHLVNFHSWQKLIRHPSGFVCVASRMVPLFLSLDCLRYISTVTLGLPFWSSSLGFNYADIREYCAWIIHGLCATKLVFKCCRGSSCVIGRCAFNFIGCLETSWSSTCATYFLHLHEESRHLTLHIPTGTGRVFLVDILSTLPRLLDLHYHPLDYLWKPVAMPSLLPQPVVFGFLPLACLVWNASCSTAHQCGLPVCIQFVKGLPSVLLPITALLPMADEE